jgi:hypothetical protein
MRYHDKSGIRNYAKFRIDCDTFLRLNESSKVIFNGRGQWAAFVMPIKASQKFSSLIVSIILRRAILKIAREKLIKLASCYLPPLCFAAMEDAALLTPARLQQTTVHRRNKNHSQRGINQPAHRLRSESEKALHSHTIHSSKNSSFH